MKSVFIVLLFWGINLSWARGPSIIELPEYIDTEQGRPFLFSFSQGLIVVQECDPAGISASENSCKPLPGSRKFQMERGRFADILKLLLLLEEGNYTPDMKEKIKYYNAVYGQKGRQSMIEIAKARQAQSIVTSPIDVLSLVNDMLKGETLCFTQDKLPPTGVYPASFNIHKVQEAVSEIDKRIKHLVEGISSSGLLMYTSPKSENRNFSYNLLSTYLSFFLKPLTDKKN